MHKSKIFFPSEYKPKINLGLKEFLMSNMMRFLIADENLTLAPEDTAGEFRKSVRAAVESLKLGLNSEGQLTSNDITVKSKVFNFLYKDAKPAFRFGQGLVQPPSQTIPCLGSFLHADINEKQHVFNVFLGAVEANTYLWVKYEDKDAKDAKK
jgi:hypothetical protein